MSNLRLLAELYDIVERLGELDRNLSPVVEDVLTSLRRLHLLSHRLKSLREEATFLMSPPQVSLDGYSKLKYTKKYLQDLVEVSRSLESASTRFVRLLSDTTDSLAALEAVIESLCQKGDEKCEEKRELVNNANRLWKEWVRASGNATVQDVMKVFDDLSKTLDMLETGVSSRNIKQSIFQKLIEFIKGLVRKPPEEGEGE